MATELKTEWQEPQLRQRLEPSLRRLRGAATIGDIVADTGLPAERTEPVLRQLLDEYQGRIAVDDNGELVYSFPHGLSRPSTARDFWRAVGQTAWNWFKLIYKVGYSIILVAYFVVFVVLAIAMMVAMLSRSDSDFDLDLDGCGCLPTELLWFMPMPGPGYGPGYSTGYGGQQFGRRQMAPQRQRQAKPKGKPFWQQVFAFVFGDEQAPADPLAEEKRLLAYVRDHQGRVTATEIAGLRGCSLEEAEDTLLHLMVAHGGDVEVSDHGTLVYTFDRLMVSAQTEPQQGRRWSWWWERHEPPQQLNTNDPNTNAAIGFLNAFNLIASGVALFGGVTEPALWFVLGVFPFTFSALFFLIPLLRSWQLGRENAARAERNALRRVAEEVFYGHLASDRMRWVSAELLATAQSGERGGSPLSTLNLLLKRLAAWWQAEETVTEQGRTGYQFQRAKQELADAEAARGAVTPDQFRLGGIAYDTEVD